MESLEDAEGGSSELKMALEDTVIHWWKYLEDITILPYTSTLT